MDIVKQIIIPVREYSNKYEELNIKGFEYIFAGIHEDSVLEAYSANKEIIDEIEMFYVTCHKVWITKYESTNSPHSEKMEIFRGDMYEDEYSYFNRVHAKEVFDVISSFNRYINNIFKERLKPSNGVLIGYRGEYSKKSTNSYLFYNDKYLFYLDS